MTRVLTGQTLTFRLNPSDGVPPYLQIVHQTKQALRMGVLKVGNQLPTVKEVVTEVGINPNTVLKAYRELEHEGLVEGRQGVGTFVRSIPAGPPPITQTRLARGLERWVRSARAEGLEDLAMESMLRSTLRDIAEAGTPGHVTPEPGR